MAIPPQLREAARYDHPSRMSRQLSGLVEAIHQARQEAFIKREMDRHAEHQWWREVLAAGPIEPDDVLYPHYAQMKIETQKRKE